MDVTIKGKNLDVGEALRGYAEENLAQAVAKYFDRALAANVIFSREGHRFNVEILVHAGRGMMMQGGAEADDAHTAFDGALVRVAKRLRRYKRRLRDHHKGRSDETTLPAQQYILATEREAGEDDEGQPIDGEQPAIIAEMAHEIATLTVGEAVQRMDLGDLPVMMFRNRAHNGLNVVYRRADGNVGWIDPRNIQ
jgi:ribosomal subunit interface protein